ncbi:MAG: hypothetical protein JWN67_550 [Actinomycetia bacterium]|nr:hypothetical protein [Actinomycetes bacterium]
MAGARGTADRFRDLVHRRLLPGLADQGFADRLPGSLAATEAFGVTWLLDLDVAGWSTPEKVCFTVSWGAHVPGVDEVVGDPAPEVPTVAASAVHGRLGVTGPSIDPVWFEMKSMPRPLAAMTDTQLANHVLTGVAEEIVPILRTLSTPVEVQRHLHAGLVTGRGAPSADELQTIRRIAALSLLLGDRRNAARWLDHLEERSSAAMAPDLVAERLAPIRERLAS